MSKKESRLTTVQIDTETRDKLKVIAKKEKRSMFGQLVVVIDREFKKMQRSDHSDEESDR